MIGHFRENDIIARCC